MSTAYPPLLQGDSTRPPGIPSVAPAAYGEGVIDDTNFQTIEVEPLFQALNHTQTRIGQAVLYRSLARPLDDAEQIRAKQDALGELEKRPELGLALNQMINEAARGEADFWALLYGEFLGLAGRPAHELEFGGYGYDQYRKGTRFLLNLTGQVEVFPEVASGYLRELLQTLREFSKSRAHELMRGPVYRSEKGLLTRSEKRWYIPAVAFKPTLFKPLAITLLILVLVALMQFAPIVLDLAASVAPVFWLFLLPLGMVYVPIVGGFDRDGCIYPLRDIFKRSPEVQAALDALGQLDELASMLNFKEAYGHPVCLPKLLPGTHHSIKLKGVRNPVLGKGAPDYVANDLSLTDERLLFVTGPNSGGKTAFCKTLAQSQLLAQIGGYVPAASAELTVADRIYYQVPEISHLGDGEGRFGAELKRTKAIFLASSARSLVILDELSEGTTHEEKIAISSDILDGFREKGATTILITHNHELVERFQKRQTGLTRQVEFKNDQPTYRLVEGVSTVSHADRVARKIGFGKEDIARLLKGEKSS
ncbi:DNA mismatch repair protein MutS [Methylococcus sp. EFPC2]|uniref:MutS-related protein n=1 Tax=Methylococcus sp. EFPC2 TaxID=2812648 RepID=UPI0019686870|nr:DNA mismatch repair protein MutS [Methylococcus sp. EFPC2]QSA96581.1 DNA mismatch repair protein MutS [Methylococcus sp. EFPC2]